MEYEKSGYDTTLFPKLWNLHIFLRPITMEVQDGVVPFPECPAPLHQEPVLPPIHFPPRSMIVPWDWRGGKQPHSPYHTLLCFFGGGDSEEVATWSQLCFTALGEIMVRWSLFGLGWRCGITVMSHTPSAPPPEKSWLQGCSLCWSCKLEIYCEIHRQRWGRLTLAVSLWKERSQRDLILHSC